MPPILSAFALLLGAAPPLAHVAYTAWVRRRFPAAGEFAEHRGGRLHHVRSGNGPAVALVHGANGTWQDFPPELISDLARDHTVLAMDRPGHGWSGAPLTGPLGLAENAEAVLALLRHRGAERATLVGNSYGAAVALRAAIESPELVSHVVAVTPCTTLDPRNARYARAPLVGGSLGRLLFQYFSLGLLPFAGSLRADAWHPEDPPVGFGASRAFAYIPSQMHASARNFRSLAADMHWLAERMTRFRGTFTVLAGADDRVTPPARHVDWLRHAMPDAYIEVMPDVGHWLVRLRHERVAEAVRAHSGANGAG
jgi:pimeloyl-ACP methyl ester carboxylesterase